MATGPLDPCNGRGFVECLAFLGELAAQAAPLAVIAVMVLVVVGLIVYGLLHAGTLWSSAHALTHLGSGRAWFIWVGAPLLLVLLAAAIATQWQPAAALLHRLLASR